MSSTWFLPFYVAPIVHFAMGSPGCTESIRSPSGFSFRRSGFLTGNMPSVETVKAASLLKVKRETPSRAPEPERQG